MMFRSACLFLPLAVVLSLPGCKKADLEPDAAVDQLDAEVPVVDATPFGWEALPAKKDGGPGRDGPLVALDGQPLKKDGPTVSLDAPPPPPDFTSPVGTLPPLVTTTVAAIQYAEGQAAAVKPACTSTPEPDVCALKELTLQARQAGAAFVLFPEDALFHPAPGDKIWLEYTPAVGDNPGTSSKYSSETFAKTFSYQAAQLGIYLIIHMHTINPSDKKYYSTQVAFGPDGVVLAVHRKFNLFGNESTWLTPGNEVEVFQTPLGKMGLLVCADIYGSSTLLNKLAKTLGARVVLISSYWTVSGPIQSYYLPYAKTWGVYAAVGNTTDSPGYGGVIATPTGTAIAQVSKTAPSVLLGTIPLP